MIEYTVTLKEPAHRRLWRGLRCAILTMSKQSTMTTVEKYTKLLCSALVDDFKHYSIKSNYRHLQTSILDRDLPSVEYLQERIKEYRDDEHLYEYIVESGKKYHKVIMVTPQGNRSVHCFVDKETGDVYKAASWSKPAKGIRFNLLDEESRERCLMVSDWAGGYLYK